MLGILVMNLASVPAYKKFIKLPERGTAYLKQRKISTTIFTKGKITLDNGFTFGRIAA